MSNIRVITQFSVFLVNKPGVLAQVTGALAKQKINLIALTLVDAQEHGVLRFVTEEPLKARAVLVDLNLPTTETDVLLLDLPNRAGALADVATLLGQNHININYAYCTGGAPGGRASGIFKVADQNKAIHLLEKKSPKPRESPKRRGPQGL
jgi:hypothetical protein